MRMIGLVHSAVYVLRKRHRPPHARRMGDAVDQALGQAVRKLRTERGWSQADLALRAGMDRNYLSLIELGSVENQAQRLEGL